MGGVKTDDLTGEHHRRGPQHGNLGPVNVVKTFGENSDESRDKNNC